jgi:hypothetical protein
LAISNYSYSCDENGNDTLCIEEYPGDPDKKNKYVTEYNDDGLKMHQTSYVWEDNAWKRTYRTEFSYNENGDLVLQTSEEWDASGQDLISDRKEHHYYKTETGIHEASESDPIVYPNPQPTISSLIQAMHYQQLLCYSISTALKCWNSGLAVIVPFL